MLRQRASACPDSWPLQKHWPPFNGSENRKLTDDMAELPRRPGGSLCTLREAEREHAWLLRRSCRAMSVFSSEAHLILSRSPCARSRTNDASAHIGSTDGRSQETRTVQLFPALDADQVTRGLRRRLCVRAIWAGAHLLDFGLPLRGWRVPAERAPCPLSGRRGNCCSSSLRLAPRQAADRLCRLSVSAQFA
jgi:hypothetical protein